LKYFVDKRSPDSSYTGQLLFIITKLIRLLKNNPNRGERREEEGKRRTMSILRRMWLPKLTRGKKWLIVIH